MSAVADAEDDEGYDRFVLGCLKDCFCCDMCGNQRPCAGSMAGGICDRMCFCSDSSGDDDG